MSTAIVVVAVAIAYITLGGLSWKLAYTPNDAWTVWLSSGPVLGLLLACRAERRAAILIGAAIGAAAFTFVIGDLAPMDAVGYAAIEVLAALAGMQSFAWITPIPTRLERPRELAALVAAALVLSIIGGLLAAAWSFAGGTDAPERTFRVWTIGNTLGTIVTAPLVIAWADFRVKRSGGLTMPGFMGGAIAAALLLVALQLIFGGGVDADVGGVAGRGPTYLPVMFMALVALLWGSRGAALAAFAATLLTLFHTAAGRGPFANITGWLGDPELEAQGYTATIALTGLLVAALASAQRTAMRAARDWRTRFAAAIGAHRLIAYDWDPVAGGFAVTGDTAVLLGVAPDAIRTLADWLSHVASDERDAIAAAFALRGDGGASAPITYRMTRADGTAATLTDEAQPIRDHDGSLHRITGIVRVAE